MKNSPDLTHIAANCAHASLSQASRVLTQWYDNYLRPSGLTASQFTLLVAVSTAESLTITPLAHFLKMDRTTLTRNLHLLENKGWVTLRTGDDQRQRVAELTAAGRERLVQAVPLWEAAQAGVEAHLGQLPLERLRQQLEEITRMESDRMS